MFEEPEAHIYPFVFSELILTLYDTLMNNASILITTHSGSLAQRLWEEYNIKRNVKIYYVYRDPSPGTMLYEIIIPELLKEGIDIESLILQPSSKIKELIEAGVLHSPSTDGGTESVREKSI